MSRTSTALLGSRLSLSILVVLLFVALATATSHRRPEKEYKDDHRKECIRIYPGQSIQAVLDHARPYTRIEVLGGTYKEQLTIAKDGIHLVGRDAVLLPPDKFEPNLCTGLSLTLTNRTVEAGLNPTIGNRNTEAGICVRGKKVELLPYVFEHRRIASVGRFVNNVRISGFTVSGFDINIAAVGAENLRVANTTLNDGGQYGLLTVGCKSVLATHNAVSTTTLNFVGLQSDDLISDPPTTFEDNDISGYFTGLVSQTPNGTLLNNKVSNVCVGAAADPGTIGTSIKGNSISTRRSDCSPLFAAYGAGVVVFGASNTTVTQNHVKDIRNNGTGVGVFLLNGPGGEIASGNSVSGNVLRECDVNVYDNSTEPASNMVRDNNCTPTPFDLPATACA